MAVALPLTVAAVYSNSLSVPLLFDDLPNIRENSSIHSLWTALFPPSQTDATVAGRPAINLSLAINYALSGLDVRTYHVTNLLIHSTAAMLLWAILLRTLRYVQLQGRALSPPAVDGLALGIAALWALHPLHTQSVTYISQRAESLTVMLIFATLWCAIRAMETTRPSGWTLASIACCAVGMAGKEIMVSTPLIVLLWDRAFTSGSFAQALRQHRRLFAGLAATWLILIALMLASPRTELLAEGSRYVTRIDYLCIQAWAIPHYLYLVMWPASLIFDYGFANHGPPTASIVHVAITIALLVLTVWLVIGNRKAGFALAAMLLVLAPSSSLVPIGAEPIAEHRMYLPTACVLAIIVIGAYALIQRAAARTRFALHLNRAAAMLTILASLGLGARTYARNVIYQDEITLWRDTATTLPGNARAWSNLSIALGARGVCDEQIDAARRAIAIDGQYPKAHFNLAMALQVRGQNDEALGHLRAAVAIDSRYARAWSALGGLLMTLRRPAEAIAPLENLCELQPLDADALHTLGLACAQSGQLQRAVDVLQRASQIKPLDAAIQSNLGSALVTLHHLDDARIAFDRALQLQPDFADAHHNLAAVLAQQNNLDAAIEHAARAIALGTQNPEAFDLLARLLLANAQSGISRHAVDGASVTAPTNALQLARTANELTGYTNPRMLATLSQAQMRTGDLTGARESLISAMQRAQTSNDRDALAVVLRLKQQLDSIRSNSAQP